MSDASVNDRRDLGETHHELLNRIAVVSMYAELLGYEKLSSDQREMIDEIVIAATRAQSLAEELREALT